MPDDAQSLEPLAFKERLARMLEFRPKELLALGLVVALIAGGAIFAFARARPRPEPAPTVGVETAPPTIGAQPEPSSSPSSIFVHVAGAVHAPGVYEFAAGARVADALRAAGGPTSDADANAINLARPLTDGERIYVPRRGETPPPDPGGSDGGAGASAGGKVNINRASASELEALPGIGPALAKRIVDYREQHGPFRSARDLMKVEGIGEKKFAALEEYVTV